jgi:hypothetical protein
VVLGRGGGRGGSGYVPCTKTGRSGPALCTFVRLHLAYKGGWTICAMCKARPRMFFIVQIDSTITCRFSSLEPFLSMCQVGNLIFRA